MQRLVCMADPENKALWQGKTALRLRAGAPPAV
jgi:hypothetical protein